MQPDGGFGAFMNVKAHLLILGKGNHRNVSVDRGIGNDEEQKPS